MEKIQSFHRPDFETEHLERSDLKALVALGVRYLGLDFDGTMFSQKVSALSPLYKQRMAQIAEWMNDARAEGIEDFVVVTNIGFPAPWLLYRLRLARKGLKVRIVHLWAHELKPKPAGFERMLRKLGPGATKENTAFIGDRLDTDMLGAQRFGLKTVWVTGALHKESSRSRRQKERALREARRQWGQ